MQDLNDLYFFAQVVEHGGFSAAARALGMPRSRLSRRIAVLENGLGVRLIQRSTRRFQVTDLGREYYGHCVAMLVEAEAAQEAIDRSRAKPRGVVRVSCPAALLFFQVGEMIVRFMASCPHVELRLENTNRRVDVIAENVDVAFRVRFPPLEDTGLVMRELGVSPQSLVAAPSLLAGRDGTLTAADLASLPSLAWSLGRSEHDWRLEGPEGASVVVRHEPRLVTEDMISLRRAALAGLGVVQLPTMVVDEDLRSGALVEALPDWAPRSGVTHLVFPTRRGLLPATRAFIDHVSVEYEALARGRETRPMPATG
ncbi:MAG: LysR family transcriptional regulator [Ancylobacter novellus]|uniref:LysR family transcriptional regulator n=1 Tax=Ancylobacter novellus TaxID=921 RepID=A0A2W5KLB7_ANCNO|nr:MAG: LysR family transcriptional regulator [Ancylobacter novellus]